MLNRFWINLVFILIGIIFNGISMSYASKLISASNSQNMNGPKLWANNCMRCHNSRAPTEYTPNQWNTIMLHMRIQGGLTKQESKEILAYLTEASLSEFTTGTSTNTSSSNQQGTQSNEQTTSTQETTEEKSSGITVYQKNCSTCHGANGKGITSSIPDFTKKGGVLSQSPSVLLNNITNGIGSMPAKGGNSSLTDQDLQAVLDYIENTFAR
ncbi:cytochrome c [Legionella anisa]|nr:cytochrome c [Legionella anisa]KTC68606.1 Cytochrome c6 [Legionella anisa]MBN5937594.1 cytochrome c [Legionella anisa]UAK81501.1 cytochrome c [Legionella anisa]